MGRRFVLSPTFAFILVLTELIENARCKIFIVTMTLRNDAFIFVNWKAYRASKRTRTHTTYIRLFSNITYVNFICL